MASVPTVTVLGSCRAYRPMEQLAESGRIQLRQHGIYSYTHSTKEHLQLMQHLRGEVSFPDELVPYIRDPQGDEYPAREAAPEADVLADTDLLIVELSSLKEIRFRGYFLSYMQAHIHTARTH